MTQFLGIRALAWPTGVRSIQCPSQELNLILELRTLACYPAHSQDVSCGGCRFWLVLVPRQGVEPRLVVSKTTVLPSHSQGRQ